MKQRESNETPSPKRVGDGQKFGESVLTCLTLYTQMTTIVVMYIGTLITNDDYSRHGHYRVVSALCPAAT